ncbi:MAG TPA: long-chain fatty acid--CoA ligase, partial [Ktedonobacterales bacterium]
MRTESAGRNASGASAPTGAAASGAPVNLDAFVQRRLPVLPPGGEEHVVAMFRERSVRFGPAPRWQARRDGVWRGMTWSENQALVNELIAGLGALGAHAGTRVGILSETRWEWLAADWAILGLGAVTVPIYPSLTASVVEFILNDANIEYLFVENAEQYEKLAQVTAPALKAIITLEPVEGREPPPQVRVMSFEALRSLSGATPEQAEALARDAAERIRSGDIASVIYTSGTTGRPKGVIHTHAALMAQVRCTGAALTTFQPGMRHLLWLPLAHVLGREEHLLTVDRGGVTMLAGSIDTLAQDIREARPNIIVGVPRIYEKAYAAIEARVKGAGQTQARIFAWAKAVGLAVVEARERGVAPSVWLRLRYALADRLVFRQVREAFGGQVDFSITGGAPIAADLLRFFHAAGIMILEGWGLTETMGAVTVNRLDRYRLGSVGPPTAEHAVRIAEDGEVLIHGPCVFAGYLNLPAEDAAALDSDRWLHSGDLGRVDADGFVFITGRKKELIVTAGGKKVGPDPIEARLKDIEGVSEAFVYGDRKPYLVALLTLDPTGALAWARRRGLSAASAEAVAASPEFARHLDEAVARVNSQLARYETIKRYAVAPEDFTIENGLLTPTQ